MSLGLLGHLLGHLAIALVISFFIYRKTKKIWLAVLCLFVSFAIDIDHLADYWIAYGFGFSLVKFLESEYFGINKMVFVPLHSWELVGLFFLLSKFVKKYKWIFLTIALAMLGHMLWDMLSYGIFLQDYFLIWRGLRGFKVGCGS